MESKLKADLYQMVLLLDLLRGLAALWVFVFHVKDDLFSINNDSLIYSILEVGYLGVPMFFVISGYVITYSAESHLQKQATPLTFIKRRLIRIYPMLWLSIAITILLPLSFEILSFIKTGTFQLPSNSISKNFHKYDSFEWLNVILLTKIFWQSANSLANEFSGVNTVFWSLAIEVQFYWVIFLGLFFKTKFKVFLLIITCASLALLFFSKINQGLFIYFWMPFSFGVFLAHAHKKSLTVRHVLSPNRRNVIILAILIAYYLNFTFYPPKDMSNGLETGNLLFSLLFACTLWLMHPIEEWLISLKKSPYASIILWPFLSLGAMSYTVYLLHTKIYVLAQSFSRYLATETSVSYGVITILITLIMCFPLYLFIERRFMSIKLQKIHSTK